MSGRLWAWQCKRPDCRAELGIVEDGQLFPRTMTPIRVSRDGTVWARCTAILASGALCNQERGWRAGGRGSTAA